MTSKVAGGKSGVLATRSVKGAPQRMTKAERSELTSLIRKRERVMKAAVEERSAQVMAEFDAQSATIYSFNNDAVWSQAHAAAEQAVADAQAAIEARCRALGIPPEFSPGVSMHWYGRGQNAVASRRAELRRVAKSRVDAMEREAKVKIERLSLAAQTEIVTSGLESDAAKAFLEKMPSVELLMPALDAGEIKALIDTRKTSDHDGPRHWDT